MRVVNQEPEDYFDVDFGEPNPVTVKQSMSVDLIISDLWDICDDGWQFSFKSDQWWYLKADCVHGTFTVESKNTSDFTSALVKLYHKVFDGHNDVLEKDN